MLGLDSRRDLTLRRVRMHGTRDALRARHQFERVLAGVDRMSLGISPSAVLIVRRLVLGTRAAAASQTSFGDRVSLELRHFARLARRPWLDADASAAEAVLFADEAELVACLVRDWLRGLVGERWWWSSVLGDASQYDWLRQNVITRGEVLVPAISLLAKRGEAIAFIAHFDHADSEAAIAAIARTYSLSLVPAQDEPASPQPRLRGPDGVKEIPGGGRSDMRRDAFERLLAEVPEARAPALVPAQRRLLGLALALTRAPSWARTPRLASALRVLEQESPEAIMPAQDMQDTARHERSGPVELRETVGLAAPSPAAAEDPRLVAPFVAQERPRRPPAREPPRRVTAESAGAGQTGAIARTRTNVEDSAAAVVAAVVFPPAAEIPAGVPIAGGDAAPVVGDAQFEANGAPAAPMPVSGIEVASRVPTRFGGIFYLLNAALALGIYGDFTAPRAANLTLSPWDWLAMVGRAWFGDEIVGDPVWTVLADLAGRDRDEEPGRDFEPPSEDWFPGHLAMLQARIALAIGPREEADLTALVCRHEAGIEITAAMVHVHLSLRDLPLSIRIAGLDRDPGWIPAAGRDVRFHFA